MSIISLNFYIFFLVVLAVYYLLPKGTQWIWLLVASIYYYSYKTSPAQLIIFIAFLLINWVSSLYCSRLENRKKLLYVVTLVFDVVFLSAFKYSAFIFSILSAVGLSGLNGVFAQITEVMLAFEPPHISYFALIIIGYLTDVYWDKYKPQTNPFKFMLFGAYFPITTSGPFIRYKQVDEQLFSAEKNHFSYIRVVRGLERVIWGLFKKLVISQRCAVIVNTVYGKYQIYPGFYILMAVIIYAFQIYTDFSGLIDMILGFSECLGIDLPENFRAPFFSRSIAEFWRRWHITLGAFLKDYVLFSLQRGKAYKNLRNICKKYLGKDYKKKYNIPVYFTMLISWFIIGLWHGGGWNYIFGVGIYMWLIIVLSDLLQPTFGKIISVLHINTECESFHLFQQIRTFFIYIFGLSFFRAESMKEGFALWKSAFSQFNPWIFFDESLYNLGLDRREMGIMIAGLLVVLVSSYISEREDMDIRDWLFKQNFVFRVILFAILFAVTLVYGQYGAGFNAADFIYGRF